MYTQPQFNVGKTKVKLNQPMKKALYSKNKNRQISNTL